MFARPEVARPMQTCMKTKSGGHEIKSKTTTRSHETKTETGGHKTKNKTKTGSNETRAKAKINIFKDKQQYILY